MWQNTLRAQCHTLVDAEAVLFVDDDQRKPSELDGFLKKRMSTHGNECIAATDGRVFANAIGGTHTSGQEPHRNAERFEPLRKIEIVLLRKDFSRRHDRCLTTMFGRANGSE